MADWTDWSSIKAAWSRGWNALYEEGKRLYQRAIEANPSKYLETVKDFVAALTESRATLDRIKAKLPDPPKTEEDRALAAKVQGLEKRYNELAAGFYSEAVPAGATSTGIAPIIVVAGLAVGVGACAWAVAAYEYAVNLREQTALAEKELDARIEASKQGRTLQPSTLPQPEPPSEKAKKGVGMLVVGGLALAAAVVAVPVFLKGKGK